MGDSGKGAGRQGQPATTVSSFGRPEVAAAYASAPLFASGDDLTLLRQAAALTGRERVLDLGAAAGHAALALAPEARTVVALDPSIAMLREGQRLARARDVANLWPVVATADSLPFPGASFALVTCRYAAHHFPDLPGALYEVARVLHPDGRLLVVDTIAPEDDALDDFLDRVERTRDPSHAHDYRLSEWEATLAGFGLRMTMLARWNLSLDFTTWVARVGAPPAAVARLEEIFDTAPAEAVRTFGIVPPPRRAFHLLAALFVAEPR